MMKSHERANDKFKTAYRSAASILSKSTKRSENDIGERTVNIQNLTKQELIDYKVELKKQRAAINREERIRYREENKKETDRIIIFVSAVTLACLSIFLYKTWQGKVDNTIDHSEEIISQYNYSQAAEQDNDGVDILDWIKALTNNLLDLNMGKGGK